MYEVAWSISHSHSHMNHIASPSLFTDGFLDVVRANTGLIDSAIVHHQDFEFT